MLADAYTETALIISSILLFSLFVFIYTKRENSQIKIAFLFNIGFIFISTFGLFLQSVLCIPFNINPIYFEYFVYIGTCFLPISLLFTGIIFARTKIKFRKSYCLLLVIPILSLFLLWTNDYHHLFYENYSISRDETKFGPYVNIHLIYTYGCLLIGLFYLTYYSIKNSRILFQAIFIGSIRICNTFDYKYFILF